MSLTNKTVEDPLGEVWRALADPSRRRMLELLRERPHTTGQLASEFPISRYGVMQHLKVLVGAGLVNVERRGRQRWNYLETLQLSRLHTGWLRDFVPLSPDGRAIFEVVELVVTETLDTSVARVWQGLCDGAAIWWGEVDGPQGTQGRFDARRGGSLIASTPGGDGRVIATVIGMRRGRWMVLEVALTEPFGVGRRRARLEVRAEAERTEVQVREVAYGRLRAGVRRELMDQWCQRLQHGLQGVVAPS